MALSLRTNAANPWCHLICFSMGRFAPAEITRRRAPSLHAHPCTLGSGSEGFFPPACARAFHRRPLSLAQDAGYFSSSSLILQLRV